MNYRTITVADNAALAKIIRDNLEYYHLDVPGTAYFDPHLDHLSDFYLAEPAKRHYFIITDERGEVIGGIGLAEVDFLKKGAELQKLYLARNVQGAGMGYEMIRLMEDKAKALGYQQIYLETHSNLAAAIHMYRKCGYHEIPKPNEVVHSGMDHFFLKSLY